MSAGRRDGPTDRSPPTIVIADDHPATLVGVRMALVNGGFSVVGEATDRDGAVSAVLRTRPDLCLLDVRMPGGGIAAARQLSKAGSATAVVMLTVSEDTDDVLAALRAGAVGFLPKDTRPDRLPVALRAVLRGEAALPRVLVGAVLRRLAAGPVRVGDVELTARESEVFRMLRSGATTGEIGRSLSLSPVTVRRHISDGVAKLGASDRDAALSAIAPAT